MWNKIWNKFFRPYGACMAQAFPVLLVIRNSEGEVRWMEVRDWLKCESDNGRKPVKRPYYCALFVPIRPW
jgi:hypothetical protein